MMTNFVFFFQLIPSLFLVLLLPLFNQANPTEITELFYSREAWVWREPNMHVFEQWDETVVPTDNLCKHELNIQIHTERSEAQHELESRTFLLWGNITNE